MGFFKRLFGEEDAGPPTPESVGRRLLQAAQKRATMLDSELASCGLFSRQPGIRDTARYRTELLCFAIAPMDRVLGDLSEDRRAAAVRISMRAALVAELASLGVRFGSEGGLPDKHANDRFDAYWRASGDRDPFALGTFVLGLLGFEDDMQAGVLLITAYSTGLNTYLPTITQILRVVHL